MENSKSTNWKRTSFVFFLRSLEALCAVTLWVFWVNFEPVFKEVAVGFAEMPFLDWIKAVGLYGAIAIAFSLFVLFYIRFAMKTVQEQIELIKKVKTKTPLPLRSSHRVMR